MEEFLDLLVAELRRIGITSAEHCPYGDYITVAGCYFYAERARGGRGTIKFLGWYFRVPYNQKGVKQAAALVVKELPEKMKELKARQEQQKKREESQTINRALSATKSLCFFNSGDNYCVQFSHPDKLTVMAAAEYLQDGGFCDLQPPKVSEEDFTEDQGHHTLGVIHNLLYSLPPERRKEFAMQLYGDVVGVYPSDADSGN